MAITFIKEKKIQIYLIPALIIIIVLIAAIIIWQGFLVVKPDLAVEPDPEKLKDPMVSKIEKHFDKTLISPILRALIAFEQIKPPEETGRKNPFLSPRILEP
ncbi:MAG: hypothetical protein KYQ20_00785 [Candidatus Nealsonbacteria bacterium]|nr:hypothetical protein [Candidatus Nealsonbacteria bacterium]